MLQVVQIYGGGVDGKFVADLKDFHQSHVPTGRIVPISTFGALVALNLQPSELAPLFVTAVVKTQASCPASKAPNNVARFLTTGDISSLCSRNKPDMLIAEDVLSKFRSIIASVDIAEKTKLKLLSKFDCVVVRFVFKKDPAGKYESIDEVGHQFCEELNEAIKQVGKTCTVQSPWVVNPTVDQSASSTAAEAPLLNLVQYDAAGKAVGAERLSLDTKG